MQRKFRILHRCLALFLLLFISTHLAVRFMAIAGPQTHTAALQSIQGIYRHPVGEAILVLAIIAQIAVGVRLLRNRMSQNKRSGWATAQLWSGAYLGFFLIVHTTAAVYTHNIYGLETDFYWAAGSLIVQPLFIWFVPYYFFAIVALFTLSLIHI